MMKVKGNGAFNFHSNTVHCIPLPPFLIKNTIILKRSTHTWQLLALSRFYKALSSKFEKTKQKLKHSYNAFYLVIKLDSIYDVLFLSTVTQHCAY